MITCIIPAYNEEKNIGKVISVVLLAKEKGLISSIIVFSDGSKDKTAEIAKQYGADEVIINEKNKGKGFGILECLRKVKNGDVLLLDADLINLKIEHLEAMIDEAKNQNNLMVIGYLSDDRGQQILPQLSGQRYLKRPLIDEIVKQKWEKSRFNIEILINRLVADMKARTVLIPLRGLNHLKKEAKYKNSQAIYQKILLSIGFANIYKFTLLLFLGILLFSNLLYIILTPFKSKNPSLNTMPMVSKKDRILVIVAHPDDEMIGAGGFMADAAKKGAEVSVVITTCGDANKFSAGVIDKKLLPKKADFIKEGKIRTQESETALKKIGVKKVTFLGFPDRNLNLLLTKNWDQSLMSKFTYFDKNEYPDTYKFGSAYQGNELLSIYKEIIIQTRPTIIITHIDADTNKDHQAVAKFTKLSTQELFSREIISKPKIYGFLVHYSMNEFPRPYRKATNFALNPPKKLLNNYSWRTYSLDKQTQNKKELALKSYKSQLSSPFLKNLIDSLDRTNELFCEVD